jgi:putative SOS response-associated peptidase YedK
MDKARRIEGRVERDPFATVLAPCPVERLWLWPVSPAVNATRHEGPELLAPVTLPDP